MSEILNSINKIFYLENKDKLSKSHTEEEFNKLSNKEQIDIAKKLKLSFKFILTLNTSMESFCSVVSGFIKNSDIEDIYMDPSTVVYLTMCALSIKFNLPKPIYRKLFSELRLRNVYGFLEDLTDFIDRMVDIFNLIFEGTKGVLYDVIGMFKNSTQFTPFATNLSSVIVDNGITLDKVLESIMDDRLMKISTIVIGDNDITIRKMIVEVINKMDKNISKSLINIDKELKQREVKVTKRDPNKIIKFSDFKGDVEQINEEE